MTTPNGRRSHRRISEPLMYAPPHGLRRNRGHVNVEGKKDNRVEQHVVKNSNEYETQNNQSKETTTTCGTL